MMQLKHPNKKRPPVGERLCYLVKELTVDNRRRLNAS